MASGGIQDALKQLGATVRVAEIALTKEQEPEYGGRWLGRSVWLGYLPLRGPRERIIPDGR